MSIICFYTLFDHDFGKPRCAGIRVNDNVTIYDLYRPGAGKKIKDINNTISKIREFLITSNDRGHTIVTSNFKKLLLIYNLPLDNRPYNIYDTDIDNLTGQIRPTNSQSKDNLLVRKVLDRMALNANHAYQKLLANAAVVYQDLENRGIYVNDEYFTPQWSLTTFSGRSKTTGFNIQGLHEECVVRTVDSQNNNVLLHFDWIAADIRVASILSNDELLRHSFESSDPYTEMVKHLKDGIGREECKKYLLRSINSMDVDSHAFMIYKDLGNWIRRCYEVTRRQDGVLETMLHRKFKVSRAKNALAVLNGAMQGSVAHAMHNVIRRLWEKISSYIITEIHDSIILSVPNDPAIIRSVISIVVPIMMYPFAGITENNYSFPLKISLGKKWKKWQLLEVHRPSGVERVKTRQNDSATKDKNQKTGEENKA